MLSATNSKPDLVKPNYEYKETDDNSIDGSLSHLVLKESFNDLASAEHFLPSTVAQNVELDA